MTTESEVTLPDALAWLKYQTGAYPVKIMEFVISKQDLEMVACPHCKKEYPDFTADSEFIGWLGICAGCMLNGVEL